jgi:sulfur-oxidizing protein SoxB
MKARSWGLASLVLTSLGIACGASPPAATPSAGAHADAGGRARELTLLFFSDAHVDLETHPEIFWSADGRTEIVPAGGYARLAAAANAIKKETGGRAVLVDGGDTFQGASAATASLGEVVIGPQRALGVDLAIPGNWEVLYGAAQMKKLARETGYPWLATNVVDDATGKLVFAPTLVREIGGVRVGFVGFTDPDVPIRQAPAYSVGLRYLGDESIEPYVRELREKEHAELVVLVTHIGLSRSVVLADKIAGVDVVLSGDTHERVYEPIMRHGVPVVEPGSFASLLGRLDVTLHPGARPTFDWHLLELRADRYPEDPAVAAAVKTALAPHRAQMDEVIGQAAYPLERNGVVETTADDALLLALKDRTGTDIALSNGFRFGHPVPPGPITAGDLARFYPVPGKLRVGKVTGAQFRAWLESELDHVFADDPKRLFGGWVVRMAGVKVHFRASAPLGHRVTSITVGDRPMDPAATYTVTACEREGETPDALCRMRRVMDAHTLDLDLHAVERAYFAKHTPIGAPPLGAVVADDLPPRVFSQYYRR